MEQWRSAYKKIYGKSPRKGDFRLAPSHIAKAVLETKENEKGDEKGRNLFAPTRLKRPAVNSPVKQIAKRRAIQPDIGKVDDKPVAMPVRESPRKKLKPIPPITTSPVLLAPFSGDSCFKSPQKSMKAESEATSNFIQDGTDPSPRKPLARSKVTIFSADTLYETKSPMKKIQETKEKSLSELQEENVEDLRPKIYRKKSKDTNFLKLNMKKGYHAKGKQTAEQKRKFKKRSNFNKFKSGH